MRIFSSLKTQKCIFQDLAKNQFNFSYCFEDHQKVNAFQTL
jgi:hypothetical protein